MYRNAKPPILMLSLMSSLLLGGCAVVTVADAVVTIAATTIKVGATVVGTTVDVAAAGVRAVTENDEEAEE